MNIVEQIAEFTLNTQRLIDQIRLENVKLAAERDALLAENKKLKEPKEKEEK